MEKEGDDKLLRFKGVAALLGISRHQLRRIIQRDPTFPRFIVLAPGILMVQARDVKEWFRKKKLEAYKQPR